MVGNSLTPESCLEPSSRKGSPRNSPPVSWTRPESDVGTLSGLVSPRSIRYTLKTGCLRHSVRHDKIRRFDPTKQCVVNY